ncbi:tyrosine-type recombinase/integrase [Amycolatopsis tucumanensis]|uniref:Tyrosine-type recombinase/integrase n=1 Tax=Amycolatopsis tucumanensis TaxID=401106 RepID=A0ABP7JPI3_9PSEU|nr:tyrosine-type recombinase/integrase [Amycolatopsis tucumanensis]MCF6425007.1 site-specific integrase [Amycolatopsis tucumanensis]
MDVRVDADPHTTRKEFIVPWPEPVGDGTWRVRYRRDDGSKGAVPGFPDVKAAEAYITDMESEQRKGTWIDPAAGRIVVAEWAPDWLDALDIDQRTEENYRSIVRKHVVPRWGSTAFSDITNLNVRKWEKHLRASGLAKTTVDGIIKCFSLMLTDAADEKIIATNPIQARRRGRRRRSQRTPRKIWAEPSEVLTIADQIAQKYGPGGAVLAVTAGWTGARWGELVGLQRPNLHLFDDDTGQFLVDPDIGSLHEPNTGPLFLGPPKTEESARIITLPPFLVRLLRTHLASHSHRHVFVTPQNELHRRSNFARRALRPAADGNAHIANPAIRLRAVKPGLTFHGLRHSHKTWMIDDGVPEIAQALRLGHVLPDKVQETYSHVARAVEQRLLDALQSRWEKAVADSAAPPERTIWRAAA